MSTTAERPVADERRGSPLARVGAIIGAVAGAVLAVVGTFWLGFGGGELGRVALTRSDLVSLTLAPSPTWAAFTVALAASLALLAGPRPTGRFSVTAVAGAVWVLLLLLGFSVLGSGWEFTGPEATCVRAGCWPRWWQELAVAAPLVVGALALLVVGLVGGRAPAWVRHGVPAVLFLVLAVAQVALWESAVIPVLVGPSPFS
ncbi:MAG: hypothetical protein ACRCY8_19470 [Dermatophilaceae bacterium]